MKKSLIRIIGIIVLGGIVLGIVRLSSSEDTWICQDGQWIAHGKPDAAMPSQGCPGEIQTGTQTSWGEIKQPTEIWLSFQVPTWRTAAEATTNPCAQGSCPLTGLRITTDQKDASGYTVYAFLKIDKLNQSFTGRQEYIDAIEKTPAYDTVLLNQPNKKLVQLEGVSWYGSFVLKIAGQYSLIEIFDFTSEQPMPAGWDDVWRPEIPNENKIMQNIVDIIKSAK